LNEVDIAAKGLAAAAAGAPSWAFAPCRDGLAGVALRALY
jgi:hypothetical protein